MCCAAVLPCCPDSLATTTTERLWASSLLVPATQHGTSCGVQFVEESGAGVAGSGCDGAARAADAVSAAPHLRRSSAAVGHGCGQRTREGRWRRGAPSVNSRPPNLWEGGRGAPRPVVNSVLGHVSALRGREEAVAVKRTGVGFVLREGGPCTTCRCDTLHVTCCERDLGGAVLVSPHSRYFSSFFFFPFFFSLRHPPPFEKQGCTCNMSQ